MTSEALTSFLPHKKFTWTDLGVYMVYPPSLRPWLLTYLLIYTPNMQEQFTLDRTHRVHGDTCVSSVRPE